MAETPHTQGWRAAMAKAWASPRCGACTRSGVECRSPAMPNGRCRMHGGASTGARTADGLARIVKANLRHGRQTAAAIAFRREMRDAYKLLRSTVRSIENEDRVLALLRRYG